MIWSKLYEGKVKAFKKLNENTALYFAKQRKDKVKINHYGPLSKD